MKIPRCMSTQHPDNVHLPFFAESPDLGGEDEEHKNLTDYIIDSLKKNKTEDLSQKVLLAANRRYIWVS